jgi:hypothetical protein
VTSSEPIFTLVPFLIIAAGYTTVAWFIHRRWGLLGLIVFWACCSAAYGYVPFGFVCPPASTCALPPSESAYLANVSLFYGLVGAVGFAGASAVILVRSRSTGGDRLRATGLVAGTLATIAGWALAWVIVPKPFSW